MLCVLREFHDAKLGQNIRPNRKRWVFWEPKKKNGRKNTAANQPVDRGSLCGSNIRKVTQNGAQKQRLNLHLYRTHIQLVDGDLVIHHCFDLLSELLMQILFPQYSITGFFCQWKSSYRKKFEPSSLPALGYCADLRLKPQVCNYFRLIHSKILQLQAFCIKIKGNSISS